MELEELFKKYKPHWMECLKPMEALKKQHGGNHYKDLAIQPAEYIIKNKLGFCEGNVVKYVTRWRVKGGVEDLKKAIHYLEMMIEFGQPLVPESTIPRCKHGFSIYDYCDPCIREKLDAKSS